MDVTVPLAHSFTMELASKKTAVLVCTPDVNTLLVLELDEIATNGKS